MNITILSGRIVRDPDVRYTQGEKTTCVAKATIAVDRKYKTEDQKADFINLTAMGKNGEFFEKYVKKGIKLIIHGHIQTGSYTNKDGKTVFTEDVIVDNTEFAESKSKNVEEDVTDLPITSGFTPIGQKKEDLPFMNIPEGISEDLPFAAVTR